MSKPIAWTIAGTDPGGGAGIQADLKTMNALGVHGCSVITALIAQNTLGVRRVEYTPADLIEAQLDALREDLPPAAVKIGMLGTAAAARAAGRVLRDMRPFTIYDPVMGASSGHALMTPDLIPAVIQEVLPLVDVLTPNIPEAEQLTGRAVRSADDVPDIARALLALGPRSVLLKGGHAEDSEYSQDYWTDGHSAWWLTSPRQTVRHTHGTGCAFSSAAAACRALGHEVADALVLAKAYVNQGLRLGGGIGRGRGSLAHAGWPACPEDAPWMTDRAEAGRRRPIFRDCGAEQIGLYPIVDRAAWLEKMLPLGIRTLQLRAKDLSGEALDREVARAVQLARAHQARLVINDRADLALKHGAWGVHLGREDLPGADLPALAAAGLRLGVSTRSYSQIARALALRPSYMAIGSIFSTGSKSIDYAPLGVEAFARMRRWIAAPVVAIGGITLENAAPLRAAGADGIAVISDLRDAPDLAARVRAWRKLF